MGEGVCIKLKVDFSGKKWENIIISATYTLWTKFKNYDDLMK